MTDKAQDAGERRSARSVLFIIVDGDCGEMIGGPFDSADDAWEARGELEEPWRYSVEEL